MSPRTPPAALRRHVHSAVVGFLGGGSVGLVGWGGAQVIIPGMTHPTMSLSQLSATGISLASLSLSTVSSGVKFLRDDSVALPTALAIGVPAMLSARIGTHLAKKLSGDALSLVFNGLSIVLIPTHFWIQRRAEKRRHVEDQEKGDDGDDRFDSFDYPSQKGSGVSGHHERYHDSGNDYATTVEPSKLLLHASYGALSGLISSLMGVGGLPLTMSYLTEFTDLHHHLVQGTAVCSVAPSVLTSALSRMGAIPMVTASVVAGGAVVGGYVGARVALSLSEDRLRHLYMASLVLFGGRSVVAAGRNIRNMWMRR